nr:unnamed protein product [Digitaria exilis]
MLQVATVMQQVAAVMTMADDVLERLLGGWDKKGTSERGVRGPRHRGVVAGVATPARHTVSERPLYHSGAVEGYRCRAFFPVATPEGMDTGSAADSLSVVAKGEEAHAAVTVNMPIINRILF